MIRALREYIIDLKKDILEKALGQLKKDLDFDSTAIDHLHLALYSFQDAVVTVLRKHNIKPHWMFALDNLVKSAVHCGITVLSPELGANLSGQVDAVDGDEDEDDVSSSGVSTVNSAKAVLVNRGAEKVTTCGEELNSLRQENLRLTRELIESQRQLQSFLKTAVDEQNVNVEFIRTFLGQRPQFERCISQGYFSDRGNENKINNNEVQIKVTADGAGGEPEEMDMASPDSIEGGLNAQRRLPLNGFRRSPTRNRRMMMHAQSNPENCDTRLNDWLLRHHVDAISRNLIHMQDFSYEDFLYESGKDDLLRIGLK